MVKLTLLQSEIHFRLQTKPKELPAPADEQIPSPSSYSNSFCSTELYSDKTKVLSCGSCQQFIVDIGCVL